jgi:GTP-binding protein
MFLGPQIPVYEGMIIGLHSRNNDLVVNPTTEKQLTNMRASGSDDKAVLVPHIRHSLEQALSFIGDDELVEITPTAIRLRKKYLKEHERKRSNKDNA